MRPSPEVLASFGTSADPIPLPGGEGTAWRAGEVVLKPAGDPRMARWTANLYRDLYSLVPVDPTAARRDPVGPVGPVDPSAARRDPSFRVPRPLRTVAGAGAAGDGAVGDWVAQIWVTLVHQSHPGAPIHPGIHGVGRLTMHAGTRYRRNHSAVRGRGALI